MYIAVGGGIGLLAITAIAVKIIVGKMSGTKMMAKVAAEGTTRVTDSRVDKIIESIGE